ncbi:MAG: 2-polyprenyl-3-methyl-6-methoxy-1,4-benzoquinone monooxygenase [Oxalobacteraceae bacterium]|nr:2-polyprenyl-3-methyl-6-methoxy-1,4-benzoquinone monooxygenase [Oxalobacteraceae bacterium]
MSNFLISLDSAICAFDRTLRTISNVATASRPNPAVGVAEPGLTEQEKTHSAGLMRVNHVGEVCAQALYAAQSAFAKTPLTREQFQKAGEEEVDHLAWTADRLQELGSRTSLLNPLWYAGSFALGAVAAKLGDPVSLGFVVETERQVEAHLDRHLDELPPNDLRSRAIVTQMRDDEVAHAEAAAQLGAEELPLPVKKVMEAMAKVMTTAAYRI